MEVLLKIRGRLRSVKLARTESRIEFSLDGQGVAANIFEVEPDVFSVLLRNEVFEIRIWPARNGAHVAVEDEEFFVEREDPRARRRDRSGSTGAEGRQNITAPMPGKVVKMLVKKGDNIAAGQGLVIVEAMKMQNEIKSPKEGVVERIAVAEGNPVNAGDVLAVIA